MDNIRIYPKQWNILEQNSMLTQYFRLKFYAANITFPWILMNTRQNFSLTKLQKQLVTSNTQTP